VATNTTPAGWQATLDADPRLVATAVQVLNEQARARTAAARRR
jgi:hypothetical protein